LKYISKLSVFVVLPLAIGASLIVAPIRAYLRPQEPNPQSGTLEWYAQLAQSQGLSEYHFSDGISEYPAPSLDVAISNSNVAVVQLIAAKSYAVEDDSIVTWSKFKILESWRQVAACNACIRDGLAPPADMLPLNPDEILVLRGGGSLAVNGVLLKSIVYDFPQFSFDHNYVLFFQRDPSQPQVGSLWLGGNGVLPIVSGNQLATVDILDTTGTTQQYNPFTDELQNRHGNSLDQLRVACKVPSREVESDKMRARPIIGEHQSWESN
jgi:hypothetical protein